MKRLFVRHAVSRLEVLLTVGVLAVAGWLVVPAIKTGHTAEWREACLGNLGRVGQALGAYLQEHDQRWPFVAKLATLRLHDPPWPTLPIILRPYIGEQTGMYHCPADRRTLAGESPLRSKFPAQTTWFETEGTSYEWLWGEAYGGKKIGEESLAKASGFGMGRADQPLLSDFELFHKGDGGGSFNSLNADLKARTSRAVEKK